MIFSIYLSAPGLSAVYRIFLLCCGTVECFSCCRWTLSCSTWDLVPCLEIQSGASALRVQSPSPWTTREGPIPWMLIVFFWLCFWEVFVYLWAYAWFLNLSDFWEDMTCHRFFIKVYKANALQTLHSLR